MPIFTYLNKICVSRSRLHRSPHDFCDLSVLKMGEWLVLFLLPWELRRTDHRDSNLNTQNAKKMVEFCWIRNN